MKLHETILVDLAYYLIMERLDGGSLINAVLEKQVYSENDARQYMKQILEAVKYLHEKGVCHADLKPDNILFVNSLRDTIKIVDFGEAFEIQSIDDFKNRGTPSYQAPEIIKGRTEESDYGSEHGNDDDDDDEYFNQSDDEDESEDGSEDGMEYGSEYGLPIDGLAEL